MARILLAAVLILIPSVAKAVVIGGGGSSGSDCLVVFDAPVNHPDNKPRNIRCVDGDPSCDADGTVNGECAFPVSVCANSTYNAANCNLVGVDTITVDNALDNGDEKFDPDFQALQSRIENDIDPPNDNVDECASSATIRVVIEGPFKSGTGHKCKKRVKQLKVVSTAIIAGKVYKDTDKIKMTCEPAPTGCDPLVLFPGGTFERIQKQIFNQSCAVSGCHDSQSVEGSLLLETGASYNNLVNAIPDNDFADAAGWKRVNKIDAMTGDPETSYIFHKLTGDLDNGFGDRMPFERRKLDQSLIDVIEAWITAGAPAMGWVPGTF